MCFLFSLYFAGPDSPCVAEHSGACALINGSPVGVGQLKPPEYNLKMSETGELLLQYVSDQTPAGCSATPITDITFKCRRRNGVSYVSCLVSNSISHNLKSHSIQCYTKECEYVYMCKEARPGVAL